MGATQEAEAAYARYQDKKIKSQYDGSGFAAERKQQPARAEPAHDEHSDSSKPAPEAIEIPAFHPHRQSQKIDATLMTLAETCDVAMSDKASYSPTMQMRIGSL